MRIVNQILRKVLRIPAPKIDRNQAIEIALTDLKRRGMRGIPKARFVTANEGLRVWTVSLDAGRLPSRYAIIDNQTGDVVKFVRPPR